MTLEDRRKYQKTVCIYKIINGLIPNYLKDIFPQNVSDRTSYPVRNAHDIDIVYCRTELLTRSFIPSAVSLWNELPDDIKSLQSISLFKSRILKRFSVPFVPRHYLTGPWKLSVLHTRLRNYGSNRNFDLYSNHLSASLDCRCGTIPEDAEHYFFRCINLTEMRIKMFQELRRFHPRSLNLLLFGPDNLNYDENSYIFKSVQTFIKDSKSFEQ